MRYRMKFSQTWNMDEIQDVAARLPNRNRRTNSGCARSESYILIPIYNDQLTWNLIGYVQNCCQSVGVGKTEGYACPLLIDLCCSKWKHPIYQSNNLTRQDAGHGLTFHLTLDCEAPWVPEAQDRCVTSMRDFASSARR